MPRFVYLMGLCIAALAFTDHAPGTAGIKTAPNEDAGLPEPKFRCSVCDRRDDLAVFSVSFSPGSETLATFSIHRSDDLGCHITLWDAVSGKVKFKLRLEASGSDPAFSPDLRKLAISENGKLLLCSIRPSQCTPFYRHDRLTTCIAFAPSGKTLAFASTDGTVQVFEVASQKRVATFRPHRGLVTAVGFGPDGRTLVTAGEDNTAVLLDITTGQEKALLQEHYKWIACVAFTRDGKTLVTGSADATIKTWDVSTGREKKTLRGHRGSVGCVAVSPDGKTLASGGEDTTVRLWDLATGKALALSKRHAATVFSVAFSPDGATLATAGADGTAKLWDMPPLKP